ncbi:hypothetical protein ACN4EK_03255 [Pantanalinema rosaneae CENA516]|uniref:hypothetical protein n=1 Tax=Pantanalinema rosaneae TaxID=1620701 RepID=UPI003D6E9962
MELEPEAERRSSPQRPEWAEPEKPNPLVVLRNTERSWRLKTLETLTPLLPEPIADQLGDVSLVAEESLNELAEIDLEQISDLELQPLRIQIGLVFIGFGALAMMFLMLYLYTLHPQLSAIEQVQHYWYQYVWFVCLGVAGLFMVGREAMRPPDSEE